MITRRDYMNDSPNLHRKYHAQFVLPFMEDMILQFIGLDKLMACKDKHLNDIPIHKWDALLFSLYSKRTGKKLRDTAASEAFGNTKAYHIVWQFDRVPVDKLLLEAGEMPSLATYVCIFKECARQMVERIARMPIEEYQARIREVFNAD